MNRTPEANEGGEQMVLFRPETPVKIDYVNKEKGWEVHDLGVVIKAPDEDKNVMVKFFGGCATVPLSQDKIKPLGVDSDAGIGDYACIKIRRSMSFRHAVVWGRITNVEGNIFTVEPMEDTGPGFIPKFQVPREKLKAAVKQRF